MFSSEEMYGEDWLLDGGSQKLACWAIADALEDAWLFTVNLVYAWDNN